MIYELEALSQKQCSTNPKTRKCSNFAFYSILTYNARYLLSTETKCSVHGNGLVICNMACERTGQRISVLKEDHRFINKLAFKLSTSETESTDAVLLLSLLIFECYLNN